MIKDKIYYTEHIISEVSHDLNEDDKLVNDLYFHTVDYLTNCILNNDDVAYFIPHFGTVYLSLSGVDRSLKSFNIFNEKFDYSKYIESYSKKREIIIDYIQQMKKNGSRSIGYLTRIADIRKIKNK